MIIFKITKKHLKDYNELSSYDIGLYGIKISDSKEIMVYENKAIADKAFAYFQKTFK